MDFDGEWSTVFEPAWRLQVRALKGFVEITALDRAGLRILLGFCTDRRQSG